MSAPQEAGKALSVVAETMRSQPLGFAILILNILWIGFFIWFALSLKERNSRERVYYQAMLEKCFDLRKEFTPEMLIPRHE